MPTDARFMFSACQAGAEKAVKAEILAALPRLRFAFSRPGFVTFKEENPKGPAPRPERSVFSRIWGEVLGQARTPEEARALLGLVPPGAVL